MASACAGSLALLDAGKNDVYWLLSCKCNVNIILD